MNKKSILLEVVREDIKYLIEAKGGKEWGFNHYISLIPCKSDNWFQLLYDSIQVCYGPLEEINAIVKAWCRIADIERGNFNA